MNVSATTADAVAAKPPRTKERSRAKERPHAKERLVVVDAVRALALLGVAVMNLHSMSGLEFLPAEALDDLQGPIDRLVRTVLLVLVDDKALAAFSFLFGLSFTLLLERADGLDAGFLKMYARRLVVLAAFGLINVAFLYWADILITYALLGFLLLLAVRLPQWAVLGTSALVLLGAPAAMAALGAVRDPDASMAADLEALVAFMSPSYTAAVEQGFERYFGAVGRETLVDNWQTINIFGLFLLGLWTGRQRIPHDLGSHRRLLKGVAAVALPLGFAACLAEVLMAPTSPLATLMLSGTPVLAIGYLATAALLLNMPSAASLRRVLARKGRLALTNYLAYGLIGQILFYGWALGLIATMGTTEVVVISLVVYALLLVFSYVWLMPFRIGPTEWVWRCLTKLSVEPLRR